MMPIVLFIYPPWYLFARLNAIAFILSIFINDVNCRIPRREKVLNAIEMARIAVVLR